MLGARWKVGLKGKRHQTVPNFINLIMEMFGSTGILLG